MAKIINLFEKQKFFDFYFNGLNDKYFDYFLTTDLGKIYMSFPWEKYVSYYRKEFRRRKVKKGRERKFSIRTEIALLVLMSVTGLSDRRLWEELKSNIYYQLFCGIILLPEYKTGNWKILSDIRRRYGKISNIFELQDLSADHWREYLKEQNGVLMDATVFSSDIHYPVTYNLLQQVLDWLVNWYVKYREILGEKVSLKLYEREKHQYSIIRKKRRIGRNERRALERRQLKLISRYIKSVESVVVALEKIGVKMREDFLRRLSTARKIYELYQSERRKGSELILNFRRPYVRAIYRGKAGKKWEYGQKWHSFMLGNMVFVDKESSENYNESGRLVSVVDRSERYIGCSIKLLGADRIYGTNYNRSYCSSRGILTNFVAKGRRGKNEKDLSEVRRAIEGRRSGLMEGIFGVLKRQYNTERIRYIGKWTERLIVFLAMMSYNSVIMSKWRMSQESSLRQTG